MNELGALLPILPYALSVALLAALLHRLAAWNDGPSLADLVSGPRDLPWPQGVQEEEPVRWDVQRLRRPAHRSRVTDAQAGRGLRQGTHAQDHVGRLASASSRHLAPPF